MVGISSYGAYVPLWRLSRQAITPGLPGEKAVANYDEDSITMAVAATIDCLKGVDRETIDGLYFASTTSPYKEKQAATIVATAADLRRDILTADFANSLRAGTTALRAASDAVKAGTAKKVLVVAADCRLGAPGSDFEQNCGDGAAALVIGGSEVAASIEASHSVSNEMLDVWRAEGDTFIRSWEERFNITEGYLKVVPEAISGLMSECNLTPKDIAKAALYAPSVRRHAELARSLGFDPKTQVQDSLFATMGETGCAYPLMLLVAALEQAKAGDRLLIASYGNGSDALILQVTEQIGKIEDRRGMKGHLASKKVVTDYRTYLQWRGLLRWETMRREPWGEVSIPSLWREQRQILSLKGAKCKVCGTVQYPPQMVCTKCHTKEQFEIVRLSEKRGELFSYSLDYQLSPMETPLVMSVVNLEGGGRLFVYMTDREIEELKVGMPLEMSFRKLFYSEGVHHYFWKSMPLRT